jgi:hypothetical protein
MPAPRAYPIFSLPNTGAFLVWAGAGTENAARINKNIIIDSMYLDFITESKFIPSPFRQVTLYELLIVSYVIPWP